MGRSKKEIVVVNLNHIVDRKRIPEVSRQFDKEYTDDKIDEFSTLGEFFNLTNFIIVYNSYINF